MTKKVPTSIDQVTEETAQQVADMMNRLTAETKAICHEITHGSLEAEYNALMIMALADRFRTITYSDGRVAGFYNYHEYAVNTLRLRNIFVLPAFRRRGLGTMMVNDLIHTCRANPQYDGIELGVSEKNPDAMNWYDRLGFRVNSREMVLKI
jgi:ribosomal protein S18 acetylase RimI-like enzyme